MMKLEYVFNHIIHTTSIMISIKQLALFFILLHSVHRFYVHVKIVKRQSLSPAGSRALPL